MVKFHMTIPKSYSIVKTFPLDLSHHQLINSARGKINTRVRINDHSLINDVSF